MKITRLETFTTPEVAFTSTIRSRSAVLVVPTLKSPSVHKSTRLTPPSMKFSWAIR